MHFSDSEHYFEPQIKVLGSLVILDVVCCYLLFILLYINIEIGKKDVKC